MPGTFDHNVRAWLRRFTRINKPSAQPENTFASAGALNAGPVSTMSSPVLPSDPVAAEASQGEPIRQEAEPPREARRSHDDFVPPTDKLIEHQWYLENRGRIGDSTFALKPAADARLLKAWKRLHDARMRFPFGSPDVVIGIIDDGFDLRHPDLGTLARVIEPWNFAAGNSNVGDKLTGGHGTQCAAVGIGARSEGKIIGAAPDCRWMPVRYSEFKEEEIVRWFDHMLTKGAWVISCSWGAPESTPNYPLPPKVKLKISECAEKGRNGKGCVIVFAAGNKGRDINDTENNFHEGFATHPDVITVAASTSMDTRAHYSNFGKEIFVCAPSGDDEGRGQKIWTASIGEQDNFDGAYVQEIGGTSIAAPLVAGICALILSVNPELTATEVKDILRRTARRIGIDPNEYDENGHSKHFGYGCVDAEAAVQAAIESLPRTPGG